MAKCSICGEKVNTNKSKIAGGWICSSCLSKCDFDPAFPTTSYDAKYINYTLKNRESVSNTKSENYSTASDEIRKFKQLLDDDIITQQEFDEKKKSLLADTVSIVREQKPVVQQAHTTRNSSSQAPKPKKKGFLVAVFILLFAPVIITLINNADVEIKLISDVQQYAGIELSALKILEPNLEDGGNIDLIFLNGESKIGTVYYTEDNVSTFVIVDNKVVSVQIWAEEAVEYTDEKSIFKMFGIVPSTDIVKIEDTGFALRYNQVTEKVSDFHISIMDSKEKTFTVVKTVFDSNYSGGFASAG